MSDNDAEYREQAEALIADLRARLSHVEATRREVGVEELRDFIFCAVRDNRSLPLALAAEYRLEKRRDA